VSHEGGTRIVVVGASAAGLKAAARAGRLLPGAEITVLDERRFISYGACGLPYFLSGDVENLDVLRQTPYGVTRDPAFFAAVKGLDVRTGIRVVKVDAAERVVRAVDLATAERPVFPYDQLVIATGARPRQLPGVKAGEAVRFFHTPEDAKVLRAGLETGQVGNVIVVGGGFIGCEVACAFRELWGCEVTLLEATDRLLPQMLDREMAALVAAELRRGGVEVRLDAPVTRAVTEDGHAVVEVGGETFGADRVVVAVGVVPRVAWVEGSGLAVGEAGGLLVDDRLRTSLPGVYAAGDCIEVTCRVTGRSCLKPLGSLANRQGRVVGDNVAGLESRFGPVAGNACVKVLGWNVAAAGASEDGARRAGLRPRAIWAAAVDRAHYYPEHEPVYLKLVYEEDSLRLLGLQAVGPGDTVKRVDVFSSLLLRDGRVPDLLDLEFCYAPPYNGALDPLHALGCAALNQEESGIRGLVFDADPAGRTVVDVRLPEEITEESPAPPGALNIPLTELRARVDELPRGRPLMLTCAMGTRSAEVARWLAARGFDDIVYLAGGAAMRSAL
jgi:NADPH-dependent 2,4-dienoyl-CoA reductase/sulfur reductase-like enzyme/rhodanese-related sulfurtransferase